MLRSCVAQIAAVAIVAATLTPNPARADSGYKAMSFYVAENIELGTKWVVANGEITSDTPAEFDEFARAIQTRGMLILFNSPGGDAIAGLDLGRLIRRYGFNTDVGFTLRFGPGMDVSGTGECASACAYAYLGGVNRELRKGSSLGYHDFEILPKAETDEASDGEMSDAEIESTMTRYIAAYLELMGVDRKLLEIAEATDPSELYQPDSEELRELGILKHRTYEGDFETKSDAKRRGADKFGIWILGDASARSGALRAA
jgi:hypothetical protein